MLIVLLVMALIFLSVVQEICRAAERVTTLQSIVEQLRSCKYECEAGPLELNTAFIELVNLANMEQDA